MSDQWRKYQGVLVSAKAPHHEVSTQNINAELKKNNAFLARWVTNFDCEKETNFWHIICDIPLELKDYSLNTRSKIKRGLNHCDVRKISYQHLLADGYEVYKSAFERYNTSQKIFTDNQFKESILQLIQKWEFWGVYFNDNLIGYSQNKIDDMTCEYSVIKFHPKYLKYYSSYALFYSMNRYYLNECNYKYVNDGSRSISHQTNIHEFLISKFKFRKAYCYLYIQYQPFFGLIVSSLFPFRKILSIIDISILRNVNSILLQEEIKRNCKKELLC